MNQKLIFAAAAISIAALASPADARQYPSEPTQAGSYIYDNDGHVTWTGSSPPNQTASRGRAASRKAKRHRTASHSPIPSKINPRPSLAESAPTNREPVRTAEGVVGGRPNGCPHKFCGCGTSLHIFGRIIPYLNLAANWRIFQSASPAPGMAAWRNGHVFAIEAVNGDGTVIAYDPNSGRGQTRIHTISLRGFHVVRPSLERLASR
jgi:hypothetical protein